MENNSFTFFLDVILTCDNNRLQTAVYYKPTFTGLGINYLSVIPQLFKINAIKISCIIVMLCDLIGLLLIKKSNFLGPFFHSNGFPLDIINNITIFFLCNESLPIVAQSIYKTYI